MQTKEILEEELTRSVIGAFFEVYNTLGFGFLESVYLDALTIELEARSRAVRREVPVPVFYKGQALGSQRVDMMVDDKVIVEAKSSSALPPTAERQLLNYLRATDVEVGLLLHFGPVPKFYRKVCSRRASQSLQQ